MKLNTKMSAFDKRVHRAAGIFWAIASDPAVLLGAFLISAAAAAMIFDKNNESDCKGRQCVSVQNADGFNRVDSARLSLFNDETIRGR